MKEIGLLQKRHRGGSVAVRWSDEDALVGFGLDAKMALSDLSERREKAGLSPRPITVEEAKSRGTITIP